MKTSGQQDWSINEYLSPANVQSPIEFSGGKYLASPSAFAGGTFGTIKAGWKRHGGDTVAIEILKKPKPGDVDRQKLLMRRIKHHVRRALECFLTTQK